MQNTEECNNIQNSADFPQFVFFGEGVFRGEKKGKEKKKDRALTRARARSRKKKERRKSFPLSFPFLVNVPDPPLLHLK
jgi:hypothetical protein